MTQISIMKSYLFSFSIPYYHLGLHSYFFQSNFYDPNARTIIDKRKLRYPNDICLIDKEEQTAGEVPFGSPGVGSIFSQVRTSPYGYAFFSLCNVWIRIQ